MKRNNTKTFELPWVVLAALFYFPEYSFNIPFRLGRRPPPNPKLQTGRVAGIEGEREITSGGSGEVRGRDKDSIDFPLSFFPSPSHFLLWIHGNYVPSATCTTVVLIVRTAETIQEKNGSRDDGPMFRIVFFHLATYRSASSPEMSRFATGTVHFCFLLTHFLEFEAAFSSLRPSLPSSLYLKC